MIRAFIFDIGNVLLRFDFSVTVRKLERQCGPLQAGWLECIEPVKSAYEAGRISRAVFQQKMREFLRFTGTDEEFAAAWADIFTENKPMTALVQQLHGRYPLYLLSNTGDLHIDFILRTFPVFGRFADAVYSYKAGCIKPEPEIYRIAAGQFGVEPAGTLFIDDLEPNVRAAREAGFVAIQYDFARHDRFEQQLRALGIDW